MEDVLDQLSHVVGATFLHSVGNVALNYAGKVLLQVFSSLFSYEGILCKSQQGGAAGVFLPRIWHCNAAPGMQRLAVCCPQEIPLRQ